MIPHILLLAEIYSQDLLVMMTLVAIGVSFLLYNRIKLIAQKNDMLKGEKNKYKKLLNSILPEKIALELVENGHVEARRHENVTILFTDFANFTKYSETVKPMVLVKHLDEIFSMFDSIILNQKIEKIKTIGDSYMCAAGVPESCDTHVEDLVRVAIEFREYIVLYRRLKKQEGIDFPEIRIGLHTGPVVAGIIGVSRTAYDVWGDTVNVAQRMEHSSEGGKINVSEAVYMNVKDKFKFTPRGMQEAKGKGLMNMYFVEEEV